MNLKVGNTAPDFTGTDEFGRSISLKDFIGKKVVLFFYPKDMTLYCTMEACNLRDNHFEILAQGIEVIGISADDKFKHQQFKTKHKLPFPLIADTDRNIINLYGVWGTKKILGVKFEGIKRQTFVIDEVGKILAIIEKVNARSHTKQILEVINKKKVGRKSFTIW